MKTIALFFVLSFSFAHANPEGVLKIYGNALFSTPDAKTLEIDFEGPALIEWDSFSIADDETTRFNMPSSETKVVNRVLGDMPSQLLGRLESNGQVILINANGIIFGENSKIDITRYLGSTFDVHDQTQQIASCSQLIEQE